MGKNMELGSFSVSLTVKDNRASQAFFEKLCFKPFAGDIEQNRLILKNGETVISLFQGMFGQNLLTFNSGWNQEAQLLESVADIREIQQKSRSESI